MTNFAALATVLGLAYQAIGDDGGTPTQREAIARAESMLWNSSLDELKLSPPGWDRVPPSVEPLAIIGQAEYATKIQE
jgi:hypothetical protein